MKSSLLQTLLNILFLSELVSVFGSVVIQHAHLDSEISTWQKAEDTCSSAYPEKTLLTEQSEIQTAQNNPWTYETWVGVKKYSSQSIKWVDGTSYYSWSGSSSKRSPDPKCGILCSTSRDISFTSCNEDHYFYCHDEDGVITFVPMAMDWEDARAYCIDNHIDLVILKYYSQFNSLPAIDRVYVWTGIRRSDPGGDWNVTNSKLDNWEDGQPTEDGDCVGIANIDFKLRVLDCTTRWAYYCFGSNLILVKENKTWEEALEHCRAMDYNNDLISISHWDQLTVWLAVIEATTDEVWTGLRYLAHEWTWIDGHLVPYQDLPDCPDREQYCGTLIRDNSTIDWTLRNCNEKRNFLCYRKY